ncbi:phosphotransferase family protein [Thermaurantiacus sp.]
MLEGLEGIERRLAAWLSAAWNEDVRIRNLFRFHGGAARETWRFCAEGRHRRDWLVMRRDPVASLVRTSRATEFYVQNRAFAAGLPVPEPLLLDAAGERLGAPGFLMRLVEGGRAAGLFETDPYGAHAQRLGETLFTALGELHALVPTPADMAMLPVQDPRTRLEHWAAEFEAHALRPQPIARAALRWLRAHCPEASGPPAIVHGDFRSGNFLVSEEGRLLALLDWEMAHIGDPMADLAWAADPLWSHGERGLGDGGRAGALLPLDAAIGCWERASKRRFDKASWTWWRIFAGFQGLTIWLTSGFEVASLRAVDPVLAFSAYYPYRFHNHQVAAMLKAVSA